MNKLSIYSLAMILVLGTGAALAGGNSHRGHGYKQSHHHYKQQHRYYKPHHKYYRHSPRHYYGRHYYPRYRGHHEYYYPSYLGTALLTSALTYSLYHTHHGAVCYQEHGRDYDQRRDSSTREVVGCHRIERLPDGSERRVEVPISECY